MKKSEFFLFLALFAALVGISFFVTFRGMDPDFGWHLKTGELILKNGVPYRDWYSYTMPDFPWVNHEWLTDVLIYKIYSVSNIYFLLLVFLCLYAFSFFIAKGKSQSFKNSFFPIALGYLATLGFLGIRPQLLTILFIAVLAWLLNDFLQNSSKTIYLVPLIFLVWVNLHGGFFAGLAIMAAVLALEIFKKTKIWQKIKFLDFIGNFKLEEQPASKIISLSKVLVLSIIATLINPYGPRLYVEIFRDIGDNFLRSHIQEWMPIFFLNFNILIYIYIGIFIGLLVRFYKKVSFNNIVISLLFLFFAISSARYFLIFIIWTMPVSIDMVVFFRQEADWGKVIGLFPNRKKKSFAICVAVLIIPLVILSGVIFYSFVQSFSSPDIKYPEKAVSFLKTLPLSENLFNFYAWGGYLIWKIPDRKLFIDGRMPSWREDGQFVFGDYVKIMDAEDGFDKILRKYDVRLFILPKDTEGPAQREENAQKYDKFMMMTGNHKWLGDMLCDMAEICPEKNIYDELHRLGWKNIYQDDLAVILEK